MALPLRDVDKKDAGSGSPKTGGVERGVIADAQVVAQPDQLIHRGLRCAFILASPLLSSNLDPDVFAITAPRRVGQ